MISGFAASAHSMFAALAYKEKAVTEPLSTPRILDNIAGEGTERDLLRERPAMKVPSGNPDRHKPWVVYHQTAVKGGFGAGKVAVSRWESFIKGGGLDPWGDKIPGRERARRLAILERYRTEPYHFIVAPWGDVVVNQPAHWRTYHGDKGNEGIGVGVDCWSDGVAVLPDISPISIHLALDLAAKACLVGSPTGVKVMLTAHRQFSAKKAADPGRALWQVGLNWAQTTGRVVDPDFKLGGLPIDPKWM